MTSFFFIKVFLLFRNIVLNVAVDVQHTYSITYVEVQLRGLNS